MAKGFTQEYNIDYEETVAPVAKMTTVRAVIVVVAMRTWSLSQMYVKNAFLNGDLIEEVYMVPPLDFPHNLGMVCKLRKPLYSLKQAPRAWFDKFSTVIYELGFYACDHDSTLFLCYTSIGCTFLLLYVDDMIITGDDIDVLRS